MAAAQEKVWQIVCSYFFNICYFLVKPRYPLASNHLDHVITYKPAHYT